MSHFFSEPVVQALGLTLLLVLLLLCLWSFVKALRKGFADRRGVATRKVKAPKATTEPAQTPHTPLPLTPSRETWWGLIKALAAHLGANLLTMIAWLMTGAASFVWLTFILVLFPKTEEIGQHLESVVAAQLSQLGHSFVNSLGNWVMMGLIFLIAKMGVNANQAIFQALQERAHDDATAQPELWQAIRDLISLAIWALAFVLAYPYLPGGDSEALKGLLVMLGTILTLGSTGLANQIMSGLVLIFSRSFKVGDRVVVGTGHDALEGVVVAITTLNVKISNCLDQIVTIPNQLLISKPVKNYSLKGPQTGNQISVRVSIGYDAPWRQVQALLKEAAKRTSQVLEDPAPYVLQNDLGDFYVVYEMYCHIPRNSEPAGVSSELKAHVQDCFNQAQIPIVSPHFSKPLPTPVLAKVPDDLPPLPADAKG